MKLLPIVLLILLACQSPNDQERHKTISSHLPDSLLIGELIDGPANVRDTVNGRLIFTLDDNAPVATTAATGNWAQVGVIADVNTEQAKTLSLEKGDKIIINGAVIGHAIEKVDLRAVMETNQGLKAELVGYTSVSNIQPGTIPEITLANMINEDTNLNIDRFITFFKRAGFEAADSDRYDGYQLEENWIDDPSPLLRLWVLFEGNHLFAVVHSRKLNIAHAASVHLKRGFFLSVVGHQNKEAVNQFVKEFNDYIVQVD